MKKIIYLILSGLLLGSCSQGYVKIPENEFVGIWELTGRDMFNGIQISIQMENGKLLGRTVKLNGNKFINLFVDMDDIWVSEITRSSNFQFKLKERKIARDLFSLYGLNTTEEFKVEFIDKNTIGLTNSNSDPKDSGIRYKRVP